MKNPNFGAIKGTTQNTLDFEDLAKQIKRMYIDKGVTKIEIVPLAKNNGKQNRTSFRSFYDPETQITWGYPLELRSDGTYLFKKVVIRGKRVFDLRQKGDLVDFILIKESPYVKGGLLRRSQPHINVKYELKDVLSTSEKYNELTDLKYEMQTYIRGLNDEELKNFAYIFKMNPEENSAVIIKRKLYEKIEKEPKAIEELINNKKQTDCMVVVRKAEERGILTFSIGRGYMMDNTIFLGNTEPEMVKYLMGKSEILSDLSVRVNRTATKTIYNTGKMENANPNSLVAKIFVHEKQEQKPINSIKSLKKEESFVSDLKNVDESQTKNVDKSQTKTVNEPQKVVKQATALDLFDDGQDEDTKIPDDFELTALHPLAKMEYTIADSPNVEEPALVNVDFGTNQKVELPVKSKKNKSDKNEKSD